MLDVVVPVYNEAATLRQSVEAIDAHLRGAPEIVRQLGVSPDGSDGPWRITIADNASTDDTASVAEELASRLDSVVVVHIDHKGRGAALRAAWGASTAPYLAYMDVDLSTNLAAMGPMLAALSAGADVVIGSRLRLGSTVVRGPKREVMSRAYNLLVRRVLGLGVADAQCGFKALRSTAAHELLPLVCDDAWFFDTELLVQAQRRGLDVVEIPVDWVDDPDSRVDLLRTSWDALVGVGRMRLSSRSTRRRGAPRR